MDEPQPVQFVRIVDPDKPGGTLVLAKRDFDPAKHKLFGDGSLSKPRSSALGFGDAVEAKRAPAPPRAAEPTTEEDFDETPGSIATVNVEQAVALVAAADSLRELAALEAAEKDSNKNPGGRKGVLKAIKERRAALR